MYKTLLNIFILIRKCVHSHLQVLFSFDSIILQISFCCPNSTCICLFLFSAYFNSIYPRHMLILIRKVETISKGRAGMMFNAGILLDCKIDGQSQTM